METLFRIGAIHFCFPPSVGTSRVWTICPYPEALRLNVASNAPLIKLCFCALKKYEQLFQFDARVSLPLDRFSNDGQHAHPIHFCNVHILFMSRGVLTDSRNSGNDDGRLQNPLQDPLTIDNTCYIIFAKNGT